MSEEFHLKTPLELRGLIIGLLLIVVGCIATEIVKLLPRTILPPVFELVSFCMIPIGFVLLIVFGMLYVVASKDISRFREIQIIAITPQGFALHKNDGSIQHFIQWKQVKTVQLQYLRYLFLGVLETRRDPTAILLHFVDGSSFKIPIYLILNEQDRRKMIAVLEHYVSIMNVTRQRK